MIALFLWLPISALSVYVFAVALGLLWLSTVPPTNSIVAQIFGVRYLAMLSGVTFFSHQIGSFLGAWLGGRLYDTPAATTSSGGCRSRSASRRDSSTCRSTSGEIRRPDRGSGVAQLTRAAAARGGSESAGMWSTASVMMPSTPHAASSPIRSAVVGRVAEHAIARSARVAARARR